MNQTKAIRAAHAALCDSQDYGRAIRTIIGVIQQHQEMRKRPYLESHFPISTEHELLLALRLLAEQLKGNSEAAMHDIVEAIRREGALNAQCPRKEQTPR